MASCFENLLGAGIPFSKDIPREFRNRIANIGDRDGGDVSLNFRICHIFAFT